MPQPRLLLLRRLLAAGVPGGRGEQSGGDVPTQVRAEPGAVPRALQLLHRGVPLRPIPC